MKVALTPRPSAAPPTAPPISTSSAPPGVDPDQAAADAALRGAFADTPEDAPPPPITKETPEPALEERTEPIAEDKKPEPVVEPVDELDKPPEGTVIPKLTSRDLRSQLEKRNTDYKQLEGEKKVAEEELTNIRKELEEWKTKSSNVEIPEKIDYRNDPAVTQHTNTIIKDLTATARTIGGREGKVLNDKFEKSYFPEFVEANSKTGQAADDAVDALRTKLDEELGEQGGRDAMALLNRSLPGYEKAVTELRKLEADSHNYRGRQTVEKYAAEEKKVKGILDPLGELPEEAIIAKPFAVESFVSKLITSDPKWMVHSQKIKKEVQEIFTGVKPLSPEERAKMEANDTGGLSQVEETRRKQFEDKRVAAMKRLYHGWMLSIVAPNILEELENLRAGHMDAEKELDALENVPAAKATPKSNGATVERDLKRDLQDVFAGRFKEPE